MRSEGKKHYTVYSMAIYILKDRIIWERKREREKERWREIKRERERERDK